MTSTPSSKPSRFTHHAYYLLGGRSARAGLVSAIERNFKIISIGNADFIETTYLNFTIDDARQLKSSAMMRPVGEGDRKIFVLIMDNITAEAQNALLKLFEEPPAYAHFFVIIPSFHLLLPTVRSRMSLLDGINNLHGRSNIKSRILQTNEELIMNDEAIAFLKKIPAKRLEVIKTLLDDISKEKKTKQFAIDFLNAIEMALYKNGGVTSSQKSLEAIEFVKKYINDRSPSMKMLFEYVSLNI